MVLKKNYYYDDEGNLLLKSKRPVNNVQPENIKEENRHPYYKLIASDWLNTPKFAETNELPKVELISSAAVQNPEWQPGDWAYLWNANGMLAKVKRPDGNEVSFEYDALGRRISKIGNKKITRYIWDGNVLLHEWSYDVEEEPKTFVDDEGNVAVEKEKVENVVTWVYERGSFVPCTKIINGESYTVVSDYIGRPIQSFDENGEIVWGTEYDIFGQLKNLKGDQDFIPFRQLGQYEDVQLGGLLYNRFRYYDSENGNYISKDPIGLKGRNPTLYGYVYDSNLWIDPFGLDPYGVNQDVYALYNKADIVNGVPIEGSKPFYIGISQNSDVRLGQHTGNGRFNPATDVKVDLHTDLDYATARAYEQFYIEKYDTIDTANPKANQQNSFRHIRAQNPDDKRGIAFESEYKKIKYN